MADLYRTTFTATVLSERPIEDMDLPDVMHECIEGDLVLDTVDPKTEKLTGPQMAAALIKAGSEPGFFMLDDEGQPVDQ